MENQNFRDQYVSLEDFFLSHAEKLTPIVGPRAARYAWALKDLDPSREESEQSCRLVQEAMNKSLAGRQADWCIMVSESHDILSIEEWIEDTIVSAKSDCKAMDTGYSDLDLCVETQWVCGKQLEAFHSGQWAKDKLLHLFEPGSFIEEEPLVCPIGMPLPHVISKLDRDLSIVTRGGMRHPYKCSVGVGVVCLRLAATDSEPEQLIPVIRRTQVSDIGGCLSQMGRELKERSKGLIDTIRAQQDNLRLLPDGWPNADVFEKMKNWANQRYVGDNGLVGSSLFDGDWVVTTLPHEIHRSRLAPVSQDVSSLGVVDVANRVVANRAAKLRADGAQGGNVPSARI